MGSNIRNAVLAIPFTLQGFKDKDSTQVLVSYFSKQEMAHEQHPWAEATKGGPSKIVLNYSHIDGKEETIADGSKFKKEGFKEMEAVHRVTAPEVSEIIDKQLSHIEPPTQEDMDAWISGRIKWSDIPEIKQAMGQMSSMLHQTIATQAAFAAETAKLASAALTTQNQLNYYSKQIEAHARAIVKLNKVLDKLDRLLSQRRLGE